MDIRRKIKILKVAKNYLYYEKFTKGICGVLLYQYETSLISMNEYKIIRNFLEENKPTLDNEYKLFAEHKSWKANEFPLIDSCWWETIENNSETRKIRIDYINIIINNLISQL